MKLIGAVSQGSGAVNEDCYGVIGADDVRAAWIFDGVTGINDRNYLTADSDAQWLVGRAHRHLSQLAAGDLDLREILSGLAIRLAADWEEASAKVALPMNYDPPAACLILAKCYGAEWKALRLGDSSLLARYEEPDRPLLSITPDNIFDDWLSQEAQKRRAAGVLDTKSLLAEFRPQLLAGRAKRNQPGGYSILECGAASLAMPEYIDLGLPSEILLCTDGYYRAADHYGLYGDGGLLDASAENVEAVIAAIRAVEAADPDCRRYPRFKPADDATAVMLRE